MTDNLNIDPSMNDRIGFGKYADCTWQQVLDDNPTYLIWVVNECKITSNEVNDMLADALIEEGYL